MTAPRLVRAEQVAALSGVRAELDERIGRRSDVIGSMVGLKYRKDAPTGTLGVTYFVERKRPDAELPKGERIPKRVRVGGLLVTTDVMVWPRMREQSTRRGTILFDEVHQGSLSCFAVSTSGVFGVSCAHCLTGLDKNPVTPTPVSVWSEPPGRFLPAGQSVYLVYSPGFGVKGSFGYLDCGLFNLMDPKLAARAAAGKPLAVVEDIHQLMGQKLRGVSALNAPGFAAMEREARVEGVEVRAQGERCDLHLKVEAPGTFEGDSGMLWLTQDGRAAAIHARGEILAGGQGSRFTTAMSAKRAQAALCVDFVLG